MKELFEEAFGQLNLMSKRELMEAISIFLEALTLPPNEQDVLLQLRDHGPVDAGDLISKAGRAGLVDRGAAECIVVKGQQGFTACTYRGWDLAKCVMILKNKIQDINKSYRQQKFEIPPGRSYVIDSSQVSDELRELLREHLHLPKVVSEPIFAGNLKVETQTADVTERFKLDPSSLMEALSAREMPQSDDTK